MLKKSLQLTAALAFLGAAGMANAAVVYVDPSSPSMPIVNGPDQTDFTWTNIVAQFDPANYSGATLNSVHIEDIGGSLDSAGGTVTCFVPGGNGNCAGSVDAGVAINLSGPAGVATSVSLNLPTFNYDFAGPGSNPIPPGSVSGTAANLSFCIVDTGGCTVNPAVVALFQGAGTVTFTTVADGTVTTTNTNGLAAADYPLTAGSTFRVRYDYITPDQVPEPASIALMGLGLAGLGLLRRRRSV